MHYNSLLQNFNIKSVLVRCGKIIIKEMFLKKHMFISD